MFQKCQGSVSFLKETLVTCNCKADCVENQAQDVIFTCVRLAEIKCTASTCLLCPSQSPPGKHGGDICAKFKPKSHGPSGPADIVFLD